MPYVKGEWTVWCDVCGFEYLASQLKKRWDGAMVCSKDWEPRHPQELIKLKPETTVPWTRPEPPEIQVNVSYYDGTTTAQGNLLVNPEFELGTTGWTLPSEGSLSTAQARTGTQSILITEAVGTPDLFSEFLPCRPGDTFIFSGWVMRDETNLPAGNLVIRIRSYDSGQNALTIYNMVLEQGNKDRSGWQFVEDVRTVSDATAAYIRLNFSTSAAGSGGWFVDSAYINILKQAIPRATFGDYL